MDRKALTGDNLARDFGATAAVAKQGVAVLCAALADCRRSAEIALGHDCVVFGADGAQLQDRTSQLVRDLAGMYQVRLDAADPRALLAAVRTYFAIVVKLCLWQVMAACRCCPAPAERIARSMRFGLEEIELWELGAAAQGAGLPTLLEPDPFRWYLSTRDERVARWLCCLAAAVAQYDFSSPLSPKTPSRDLFKQVYHSLLPRRLRHALGQYFTPDWLVEHVLDQVGYRGHLGTRLLDPACGSGSFMVAAINRACRAPDNGAKRRPRSAKEWRNWLLQAVVGFELDPLALLAARANWLIAICDLMPLDRSVQIPVYLCDSILETAGDREPVNGRFDYVVGNPPWVVWDHLPEQYRRATMPLWRRYGLFSLGAAAARHGGAKKDLAMLMLYVAADRYLRDCGRMGLVVSQGLFQSKGAGDGFRRFRLGDGDWLRVVRVDDMVACRPFPGTANRTSTVIIEKGRPTQYPVPYVRWSPAPAGPGDGRESPRLQNEEFEAEPINPDQPTSPWIIRPRLLKQTILRLVGPSKYEAHLGANSGGANAVYWLRVLGRAKGGLRVGNLVGRGEHVSASKTHVLEPDLIFPLLRWADLRRYRAQSSAYLLLAQDPRSRRGIDEPTLRRDFPKTWQYFRRFRAVLENRAAYRRYQAHAPFWSMYNVGPYTLAPWKVVWRRMDRQINAAVAGPINDPWLGLRPLVPQETCVLIAAGSAQEAHYLCALLNSSVAGFLVRSHSVCGGKGFGTPSILDFLALPRFDPHDSRHAHLAACSLEAHDKTARGEDCSALQQEMDRLAARLWGVDQAECVRMML